MALDRYGVIHQFNVPPQRGLMRVNPDDLDHCLTLFKILSESAQQPAFSEHVQFVQGRPYLRWYFIIGNNSELVGSIYLTRQYEIGVHVFQEYQRQGYGGMAVRELMRMHQGDVNGPFLANINPDDDRGVRFWKSVGFVLKHLTYAGSAS